MNKTLILIASLVAFAAGCSDDSATVGEKLDSAIDATKEAASSAAEATKDAASSAAEAEEEGEAAVRAPSEPGTYRVRYVLGPVHAVATTRTVELFEILAAMGMPADCYALDLKLVRGLDYYTGPVYESIVTEPAIGSLTVRGRRRRWCLGCRIPK